MLRDFIDAHREEILARARDRVLKRNAPLANEDKFTSGLPVFLDQLCEALRKASSHETIDHEELEKSAGLHGTTLFEHGSTLAQVVHDYGDLCQVITEMAGEENGTISVDEFRTLNLCLDDAIAGAVTTFSIERERAISAEGLEKLGVFAHEMRNLLNTALMSFTAIKGGIVAPGGSTAAIHERSLLRLNALIDYSLADVRLDAGKQNLERIEVRDIFAEVEVGARLVAETRGLRFEAAAVDASVIVEADRQILAAALTNLLQNAFKFTRADTTVWLRASTTITRVLIDVEDECGGIPGDPEAMLLPFHQQGTDRTGLGLGLSICQKAVKSIAGELRVSNLPGKGCIFTIDLPKQPPPPTALRVRLVKPDKGHQGSGGSAARTG